MKEFNGLKFATSWEENVTPEHTALIVYDMQEGITRQIRNGKEITVMVGQVLGAAREAGIRVFFTRHMSLPKEMMGAFQWRTAMAWQRVDSPEKVEPKFLPGSPGFHIVGDLAPRSSEAIVDKISMSAFEGTFLEMAMRDCGIRSFIVVGIALEIGIDPTCRQGSDLGFWPILVRDACGFGNEEAANHSLESLKHMGDTSITDVESICSLLAKVKGRVS